MLGQYEQVVFDRLRAVELFAVYPELHKDILGDVLGHVVVFEHAANEMQERGVVAHEELFIGADIAPNDRGDQFAVVLLSAESELHGRLFGFASVPCAGLRFKDKKVFHKDGILSCDKIVKKQPAS